MWVLENKTSKNDITLTAEITNGTEKVKVDGFYDGAGKYKVRFMPQKVGEWKFKTKSNNKALNGKTGSFACIAATGVIMDRSSRRSAPL